MNIKLVLMLALLSAVGSIRTHGFGTARRVNIRTFRSAPFSPFRSTPFSSLASSTKAEKETSDLMLQGLNGAQDISVKVVTCREVVQEMILRNDLSPQSGQALGELMACGLMMGAGLKGDETLQVCVCVYVCVFVYVCS
ncbi:hypothetical protein B484DRAFT_183110 [Ochromonadaceae sp. CCMP2298]|nr:hypothetical protein B484DRAFT_183110 [Ochromonadaceae sp. CCMP2298]